MRVVAGTVGGRRLEAPDAVRPTTELVRAAIANSLTSLGVLDGAHVVDLFAGSGALGIEALSRGAASAVFVESDRQTATVIRANLAALELTDRATVVVADALRWAATSEAADLALIDPPYGFDGWDELLSALRVRLAVCESSHAIQPAEGWTIRKQRHHGGTLVTLLERRGASPP
jgi:16S rRNA (guanine966-N2)-methyltransferase